MATKPDLLKWVNDDDAAKIFEPSSTKKLAGFLYKEKPAFDHVNWLFNRIYKWLLGLQGRYADIVVGSSTQVTNKEATHTIADLDDTLVVAGSRIILLDGTHTLAANLALSNPDIMVIGESPLAIIDVATYQILLTGARQQMRATVINAGANDIQLSGAGSEFRGYDVDIAAVQVSGGAVAFTSGQSGGIKISSATLSDNIMMTRKEPEGFIGQKNFTPAAVLTYGANISWDLDTQQVAKVTLTGSTAQLDNPTNMKDGGTYAIKIIQDATGGRALTFGTAYKWPNGTAPSIPQGANEYMWITFFSDGSVMDGVGQGPFA